MANDGKEQEGCSLIPDREAHSNSSSAAPLKKIGPRNVWGMLCMATIQMAAVCASLQAQSLLMPHSVSVMGRLEWPGDWHVDVLGLICCQLGQLGTQLGEMQSCNLLIQVLWQYIHLVLVATRCTLIPQLQLGNHLKRKGQRVSIYCVYDMSKSH